MTSIHGQLGGVLAIGHDASFTGAPIVLLHWLRWARRQGHSAALLLRAGGPLASDYSCTVPTQVVKGWHDRGMVERARRKLARVFRHPSAAFAGLIPKGTKVVLSNTMTNGELLHDLAGLNMPVVTYVHELEKLIESRRGLERFEETERFTTHFVAASDAVRANLTMRHGIAETRVTTVHEFVPTDDVAPLDAGHRFREQYGLTPEDIVIGGCGTMEWRKGIDLFLQLAIYSSQAPASQRIRLIWAGGDPASAVWRQLTHDIATAGLGNTVILCGPLRDPKPFFAAIDIFALTSREDPYPLVMLEAAVHGKPMVCFAGTGGGPEFAAQGAGVVVPYLNVAAMAAAAFRWAANPDSRHAFGEVARSKVRRDHDVEVGATRLWAVLRKAAEGGYS